MRAAPSHVVCGRRPTRCWPATGWPGWPPIRPGRQAPTRPGGWDGLVYFRLHGSPRVYWSSYDDRYLTGLAAALRALPPAVDSWCVFDNTASGAALDNAWALQAMIAGGARP